MKVIKFRDLNEFINEVSLYTLKKDDINEHQMDTYWFRGHSDSSWKLEPKLKRKEFLNNFKIVDVESALINDFILYYILHDKNETKKWETLIKMQHHGVATRLLDWSESALVALFFAIEKWNTVKNPPCVWVLKPTDLNKKMIGRDELLFSEGDFCNYWLPDTISMYCPKPNIKRLNQKYKNIGKSPIAMNYKHIDARSVNQRGTFVVFPEKFKKSLEECKNINLIKLELDCKTQDCDFLKKKMLAELDILGINSAVAYPDLQGLNTYLTWKHTGKI